MKREAKIKLDVRKLLGWQVSSRSGTVADVKIGVAKAGKTMIGLIKTSGRPS